MKITWDPIKREKVLIEHRVDFDKITDVFDDPLALEFVDVEHSSEDEVRFAIIGLTAQYWANLCRSHGTERRRDSFCNGTQSRTINGEGI